MLKFTSTFLILAIVAAIFGFTGIAAGSASLYKIIFFIFVIFWSIALVLKATALKKNILKNLCNDCKNPSLLGFFIGQIFNLDSKMWLLIKFEILLILNNNFNIIISLTFGRLVMVNMKKGFTKKYRFYNCFIIANCNWLHHLHYLTRQKIPLILQSF
ncbi:MAG: DUF1328 domain-containing protein [Chitinophagaceae bacterium]|nr:DUF1328 domain-containing protein [Chitinophagaceae bacterium]